MARQFESEHSSLKTVLEYLGRTRYLLSPGVYLSEKNNKFVAELYSVMSYIWLDVSTAPELLNLRWVRALCAEPVLAVVELFKAVDFRLISEEDHCYASFKHWLRATFAGYGQILSPLKGVLQHFFECQGNIAQIRTALRFITRANFPEPVGLEEKAFEKWCLDALEPWTPVDTTKEEEVLREIFPRSKSMVQVSDFCGRFGPGATPHRIGRSLRQKYQAFESDCLLHYAGLRVAHMPEEMPRMHASTGKLRVGELMFVPKWLDQMRTVNKEHPALMYYQLGAFRFMHQRFERSRWSRHVDLEHADLNGELAFCGAMSGEYATIDMSSASDHIRNDLVKQLFRGTALREMLVAFRSTVTEYKGKKYTPTYYAPMGSGLCFPTMCAVIASAVDVVIRRHRLDPIWRVYGDDIVVPARAADDVMNRLEEIGFVCNRSKSFTNPNKGFRESCGHDYLWGWDAHPVYVSRRWKGFPTSRYDVAAVSSCVALANSLAAYHHARIYVVRKLLAIKPGVIFDLDGSCGIASNQPTNFHLKKRWNSNLQREEYRHWDQKIASTREDEKFDDIRLYEWLRMAHTAPNREMGVESKIAPNRVPIFGARWGSPAPGWAKGAR